MYRYFLFFLLLSSSLKAQYVQWAQASYDGVRNTLIYDQALDSSSNQYYLQAQQNCMGCPNNYFLLKVSKQNLPRWSFPLSSISSEEIVPRKIAADIAGNVFVIGVYNSGTFTADASHILTSTTTNAPFLLKLNQYGGVKWAINLEYEALDLAIDKIGRVFLTGEGFTAAYTTAGNFIWTNNDYYGHSIATGFTNKILIADDTRIIRLNTNGHLNWVNNSLGGSKVDVDSLGRAFVLNGNGMNRISTAGVVSWTKSNINGSDFDVDAVGNIYIASSTGISKFSQSGSLRWSKSVGSITGIRCNAFDEAFLIGEFDNEAQYIIPPFALDPNTYPLGYFGATTPFRAKIVGGSNPAQLRINFNYNEPFYFINAVQHTFCQGNPLLKNGIDLNSGLNIFYQVMINSTGDFDSGNQFTYQISSNASFSNPIVLPNGIIPLTVIPGNYFLRVISLSPVKISNSLQIVVGNNPLPIITASGPTSFCVGGSVALSVSYPDPQYFDYEWHKDGNFYNFGSTVNVTDPGDYTVIPFSPDNAGCDVKLWSLPTQVTTPCRVEGLEANPVIYPNPSNTDFTIGFNDENNQRSLSIFDVNGRLIESISASKMVLSFGANLIQGVYFVKIVGEQKIAPIKIVKIN